MGSWSIRAITACSLLAAGFSVSMADRSDLTALQDRKSEFVSGFARTVRACVTRHDTSHHLFHGCIDWHSSVHGMWALTAAARVLSNNDLKAFVRSELTPARLELERAYVKDRRRFEMPYGRAWFLRLAIEYERTFDDQVLRAMADELAASLMIYLRREPTDPLSNSYDSQSWALINLRAYGRQTDQPRFVEFVDGVVTAHFLPYDAPCPLNLDRKRHSFMAICTNWAWLVSETLDAEAFKPWLDGFIPDPEAMQPVERPANAHLYGLNFSRAWGLWRLYRKSGDARYLTLYRAHLEPTFDHPDWWRGDYGAVGHWVSQFGMFAVQPLFEPDGF